MVKLIDLDLLLVASIILTISLQFSLTISQFHVISIGAVIMSDLIKGFKPCVQNIKKKVCTTMPQDTANKSDQLSGSFSPS